MADELGIKEVRASITVPKNDIQKWGLYPRRESQAHPRSGIDICQAIEKNLFTKDNWRLFDGGIQGDITPEQRQELVGRVEELRDWGLKSEEDGVFDIVLVGDGRRMLNLRGGQNTGETPFKLIYRGEDITVELETNGQEVLITRQNKGDPYLVKRQQNIESLGQGAYLWANKFLSEVQAELPTMSKMRVSNNTSSQPQAA